MLAQLRARLRHIGVLRHSYGWFRRMTSVLIAAGDDVRGLILTLWLILVYYMILTPMGLIRKILGKGFPPLEARRGWQKIDQRSCDKAMFTKKF